jgi:hypothetical protein
MGFGSVSRCWALMPRFQAKSRVTCGLDRTRTCDLADVNGAF